MQIQEGLSGAESGIRPDSRGGGNSFGSGGRAGRGGSGPPPAERRWSESHPGECCPGPGRSARRHEVLRPVPPPTCHGRRRRRSARFLPVAVSRRRRAPAEPRRTCGHPMTWPHHQPPPPWRSEPQWRAPGGLGSFGPFRWARTCSGQRRRRPALRRFPPSWPGRARWACRRRPTRLRLPPTRPLRRRPDGQGRPRLRRGCGMRWSRRWAARCQSDSHRRIQASRPPSGPEAVRWWPRPRPCPASAPRRQAREGLRAAAARLR